MEYYYKHYKWFQTTLTFHKYNMSIINALSRLSIRSQFTRGISTDNILYFKATPCLLAEPLKKKKKLDPAIIKAREERRKKKLEKQIRRLEKNSRQLKPIEELEIPICLVDDIKNRIRNNRTISSEKLEERILLLKEWSKYKLQEHLKDIQMLDRIMYSQQHALDELRKESEELYQEAIQIDYRLLPYKSEGPVVTPKIKNYELPDGEYQDVSKIWN